MVRLEMTEREAAVLAEVLESYLSDLRSEIVATEHKEWRSEMKDREKIGKELIQRLAERKPVSGLQS